MINFFLMSVPHAGSTIIGKMIHELGWATDQSEEEYYSRIEWESFVTLNNQINNHRRGLEEAPTRESLMTCVGDAIQRAEDSDATGCIIKDPRFCVCLPYWISIIVDCSVNQLGIFQDLGCPSDAEVLLMENCWLPKFEDFVEDHDITLLYLTKNTHLIKSSFKKRRQTVGDEPGIFGLTVDEMEESADAVFNLWPGPKHHISFEKIREVVKLFDVTRDRPHHPMRGRAGWKSSPGPRIT